MGAVERVEYFMKEVVNGKLMEQLGERIARFYDDLFMEMVYRAYHRSFKISFTDVFFVDFRDYVVKACGLKRNFWRYLPEDSVLRYMYERRRRFLRYLKKRKFSGDVRWSSEFWLSQLSFWYISVKSFYTVWRKVMNGTYGCRDFLDWDEAIASYIIRDFTSCYKKGRNKCVRKSYLEKYKRLCDYKHSLPS